MLHNNLKLKLLHLADILRQETDEDNPLSTTDIIKKLDERNITVNRKTLYDDIELLKEYGLDIYTHKVTGSANLYNLASREFELAELKLLVDTIQFSQLVTPTKSKKLIHKLSSLTSIHQAKQLERSVIITDRMKGMNEKVFYAIDALHKAVIQKRKVSFKYYNLTIDMKKDYRNGGKKYIVSPYTLACSNNNYYLIAFHEKYNDLSQFRIDRIDNIEVTDEPRQELPKDFIMEKYTQKVFSMYNGELKEVEIIFNNSLINAAVDRFGKKVRFTKVDDNHFAVKASLSISPTFFSWLFQFGDKVKLVAPQDVKDKLKAHTKRFLSNL
jgi:predicted DNA-binding transcriptional regulator YafY